MKGVKPGKSGKPEFRRGVRKFLLATFSLLLPALVFSRRGYSDQRFYVWTYEYKTMEKGSGELENYFTLNDPEESVGASGFTTAEHWFELEVGMNDHFDIGIYQVFEQNLKDPSFEYKKFKVRARQRFGEKGRYFVDPLIYLEYISTPDFGEQAVEAKLILAKDLGKFNISFNPILEVEFEKEEENGEKEWETEFEPEYALGFSYQLNKLLRIGVEFKGSLKSAKGHYVGPVIAHGNEHFWVALGSAFKISDIEEGKPEYQVRMLLGIGISPPKKSERKAETNSL